MGIVFRQSVKTTLVVFTGALLGGLTIWLSTKYFSKQQFGFINNLTKWAITLSVFIPIGLTNTLAVYIHRYANDERRRKMFLTICIFFPLVITVLVSMVYFLLRTWILHHFQIEDAELIGKYFIWVPVYTLLFLYMSILELFLISQMKVAIASFMREIILRFVNIGLILLFALGQLTFKYYVVGSVLIYMIPVCLFLLLSYRTKKFGFAYTPNVFTRAEYKEILHFSWYHFLLSVSVVFMSYMDALLIPLYDHKGFTSLAVYGVAGYILSLILIPSKALIPPSFAALARAFAENNQEKAKDIFVRSSINILIPTIGLAVLLCCNLDNAVAIINNGYTEIIPVFLVLLVGAIVNIATGMNDQVLSISNYYKFTFYTSLVLIFILFVMIRILVPQYGIIGAAWSTTITLVAFNILKSFFVWKKLDMQPFSKSTLLVLIAAAPALAAGYFFPYLFNPARHIYVHTFIDAALRSTVIIVIYFLMLLWLKPSPDLEEYLASVKKNKRLF